MINQSKNQPLRGNPVTRRNFVGTLAKGAGCAAAATLVPGSMLGARAASYTLWHLEAVVSRESFGDGNTIPFVRFRALPGYPSRGALGLGAMIASRPASGLNELWSGGPTFDREYVLLYHDTDARWNQAAANLRWPDTSLFEPNYFTLNGLSYPDLGSDPDSLVHCQVGERVLLRLGNIGKVRQSIHFHGYHAEIAARDNVPETSLPPKDTIPVPSDSTVDVILPVTQAGLFPLHPHFVPAVTANGLYPYGQLALIEAV